MAGRIAVPSNDPPINEDGRFRLSWAQFFQALADQSAADRSPDSTASDAKSSATEAKRIADETAKKMVDFLASKPIWEIGDYREAAADDLGEYWLLCDGREMLISDYPDLARVLTNKSRPAEPGRFRLPGEEVDPLSDTRRWIKAK